jgi:hypothetical protein
MEDSPREKSPQPQRSGAEELRNQIRERQGNWREHEEALKAFFAENRDIRRVGLNASGSFVTLDRQLLPAGKQTTSASLHLDRDFNLSLSLMTSKSNAESPNFQSAEIAMVRTDPYHAVLTNKNDQSTLPARTPLAEIQIAVDVLNHYTALPNFDKGFFPEIAVIGTKPNDTQQNEYTAEQFLKLLAQATPEKSAGHALQADQYWSLSHILTALPQQEQFALFKTVLATPIREITDLVE